MSQDKRSQSLIRWGLSYNPFVSLPPTNEEERQRVFTGRQQEVNKLLNLTEHPRGVFLVGLFGVGKSILALETLRILNEQGVIAIYVKYDREYGFSKSVLRKLAAACAQVELESVYEVLKRSADLPNSKVIELKDIDDAVYKIQSAMNAIEDIAAVFRRNQSRTVFVIIVDDLDKGTDLGNINEIIQDTRQLIEYGCAVILPGHPFGSTAGLSSSADILNPVALKPLSETELVEMMGKYLDLARVEQSGEERQTYPFSISAAGLIAKGISEFELTPRIFNFACQLLLEQAAEDSVELIDQQFINAHWGKIAEDFLVRSLHEDDKRYLKVIYKNGGFLSEDTRQTIREIGGEFAEYSQVRGILVKLIQENVLIESIEEGKRKMIPNPILSNKTLFIIR